MAAPIVDKDGHATSAFRSFIRTLWIRTGCGKGQATGISTTKGDVLDLNQLAPVGEFALWPYQAQPTLPSGWLLCDGSLISRTTFSALFAIIGVYYGAGDLTHTFELPNVTVSPILGTRWIIRALPESTA